MENKTEGYGLMLDTVLKIVSIISALVNVFTRVADVLRKTKDEHQKSNRDAQV